MIRIGRRAAIVVDYLAKQGPHRDDPSLQVGKEDAAALLAKYFVIYRR